MTDVLELAPDQVVLSAAGNDRTTFNETELTALAESIRERGQLMPGLVRPADGRDGLYELVAGERRFRACQIAGEPFRATCAILSDLAASDAMLEENLQRADLDPIDEARALYRRCQAGISVADLAGKVGRTPQWVSDRISLLALAEDIQSLVRSKQLPLNRARMLSELEQWPAAQRAAVREGMRLGTDDFARLVGRLRAQAEAVAMFDPDDFQLETETWDSAALRYVDTLTMARGERDSEDLVGPGEVAERLSVNRATVAQWRRRHADFPQPVVVIDAGNRPSLRGGANAGTPIWRWSDVAEWARATGRQKESA
jgi:ParB family chromosome partitioning protein